MLPSCNIHDPDQFAPGWLGRYVRWAGHGNAFPWSFHLLSGYLALSTVLGRLGSFPFHGGEIWPPQSVLLIGPSAVGKSQSLYRAGRIIKAAAHEPWTNETGLHQLRPGFSYSEQGFTPRGLTNAWAKLQQLQQVEVLEGVHIETEMAKVVTDRKGSETVSTWLISALEHRDLEDFTGMYGHQRVANCTVAFGFASTLAYLRKAMDVDEFAGGLMHRFLISHEQEPRRQQPDVKVDEAGLVEELKELRGRAPRELVLAPSAAVVLARLEKQRRFYRTHQLSGFWGRFPFLTCKLAGIGVLADGRSVVGKPDMDRASELLVHHLAPVLEALVEQLGASAEQKLMFDLHESLVTSGPKGWDLGTMRRKIGKIRGADELLDAMLTQRLAFMGQTRHRVYGKEEWLPENRFAD